MTSKCEVNSNDKNCSNYEYTKIIYVNYGVKNYFLRKIIAVICATFAVAKRKPEKNSGLYGIRTLDLCNTCAALYQLS